MKRTVSLILLAAVLASSISCGGQSDTLETTASDTTSESTAEPTNPEPELPYTDYKGEEFRLLIRDPTEAYKEFTIQAESENGDVVNDAVFKRNRMVEERFNINIKTEVYPDSEEWSYATTVEKLVMSGENSTDVISYMRAPLLQVGIAGCLADWSKLPYVDFDAEYWDSNITDQLLINGKLYLAGSDISMSNLNGAYVMFYNKSLIEEYKLEYPTDLVDSGTWTLDKFAEQVRAVSQDLNGDGIYDHNDLYGFQWYESPDNGAIDQAVAGSGIDYVKKDADGSLSIRDFDEKIVTICDKFYNLLTQENCTISKEQLLTTGDVGSMSTHVWARSLFANGQFLYIEGTIGGIPEYNDMEDDFGILPMPKFDENQANYYCRPDKFGCLLAIPQTAQNLDMIGEVLEYMSWASHDTVLPAFYDINLKVKKNRDDRAADMLDIIKNSMFYSISAILNIGVEQTVKTGFMNQSVASSYESAKANLESKLSTINETIKANA